MKNLRPIFSSLSFPRSASAFSVAGLMVPLNNTSQASSSVIGVSSSQSIVCFMMVAPCMRFVCVQLFSPARFVQFPDKRGHSLLYGDTFRYQIAMTRNCSGCLIFLLPLRELLIGPLITKLTNLHGSLSSVGPFFTPLWFGRLVGKSAPNKRPS